VLLQRKGTIMYYIRARKTDGPRDHFSGGALYRLCTEDKLSVRRCRGRKRARVTNAHSGRFAARRDAFFNLLLSRIAAERRYRHFCSEKSWAC
jgi:hypothetical protein